MENIFEIKFSFEQNVKDNVILKFSNKQGGWEDEVQAI